MHQTHGGTWYGLTCVIITTTILESIAPLIVGAAEAQRGQAKPQCWAMAWNSGAWSLGSHGGEYRLSEPSLAGCFPSEEFQNRMLRGWGWTLRGSTERVVPGYTGWHPHPSKHSFSQAGINGQRSQGRGEGMGQSSGF